MRDLLFLEEKWEGEGGGLGGKKGGMERKFVIMVISRRSIKWVGLRYLCWGIDE